MNLEIYYTIERHHISEKIYKEIENTCSVYAKTQGYNLVKFKRYDSHKYYSDISKDVIKKGICIFNEMSMYLKFKSNNNIWFLYISHGNTIDNFGNICNANVFLLNRDISLCKVHYIIKEYTYNIYFKEYIQELCHTHNYLNYSKVFV
jgi:hypothetical protein